MRSPAMRHPESTIVVLDEAVDRLQEMAELAGALTIVVQEPTPARHRATAGGWKSRDGMLTDRRG